jgi:hypothetical protein
MTSVLDGLLFDRAWICASAGAAVAAVSVAAFALVVGRALRGRPAPLRYGLLLAALVVLGIVPAVAAASRLAGWGAVRVSPVTVDRPLSPRPFLVMSAVPRPAPVPASAAGEEALRPERVAEPAAAPLRVPTFREAASGLLWVWLGGFVFFVGLVIRDLLRLRRLRQSLVPCPSPAAVGLLGEAARSVGLVKPPRLYESAAVPVPVVIGPAKPAVVLPAGMATSLEREKLSAVLLHEAAHVVHGDLWVGLLQHAVAAVFWWCPPVHRLNRRLAEVREEICDDYVVSAQGDGFQLAEVLVEMAAGLRDKRRLAIGTLGAIDEKPALEGRVERLVDLAGKAIPMTRMNRMAVAAAGAFGLLSLALVVATTIHAADELPAAEPKAAKADKEVVATETTGAAYMRGATAFLRIRKIASESDADFYRYGQTQEELVRRPAVLKAALQSPEVKDLKCVRAETKPVGWLQRRLQAILSPPDTLMIVLSDVDAAEATTIINAVAHACMSQEKREALERRDALERKYKENMDEVRAKLDLYQKLAQSLGTADSEELDTQRNRLLDRLRSLGEHTSKLEVDKLTVETDLGVAERTGEQPDPKLAARLHVLTEQIDRLAKESARVAEEAKEIGAGKADLKARKQEIDQLMKFTDQQGVQLNAAEIEVSTPDRVELLGVKPLGPNGFSMDQFDSTQPSPSP